MFGIPIWAGWLIGALVLAGSSFYGGIKIESDHRDALELNQTKLQLTNYTIEVGALQQKSVNLESKLENIHLLTVTINHDVEAIIQQQPLYARECFDTDGLSAANRAITGSTTGSGQPRPALSVTVPVGGRNGRDDPS